MDWYLSHRITEMVVVVSGWIFPNILLLLLLRDVVVLVVVAATSRNESRPKRHHCHYQFPSKFWVCHYHDSHYYSQHCHSTPRYNDYSAGTPRTTTTTTTTHIESHPIINRYHRRVRTRFENHDRSNDSTRAFWPEFYYSAASVVTLVHSTHPTVESSTVPPYRTKKTTHRSSSSWGSVHFRWCEMVTGEIPACSFRTTMVVLLSY